MSSSTRSIAIWAMPSTVYMSLELNPAGRTLSLSTDAVPDAEDLAVFSKLF